MHTNKGGRRRLSPAYANHLIIRYLSDPRVMAGRDVAPGSREGGSVRRAVATDLAGEPQSSGRPQEERNATQARWFLLSDSARQ